MIARELIQAVPKSDLHIHLDGSMRVATLIELAREQVELPSYEIETQRAGVRRSIAIYPVPCRFQYTCAVLRSFERWNAAFELAEDAIEQGVRYVEVRFAPQLLVPTGEACVRALKAVGDGLPCARQHGASPAVQQGEDIRSSGRSSAVRCATSRAAWARIMTVCWICCPAWRTEAGRHRPLEAVHAAVVARDCHGVPVTGFDLAGEEAGYPASHHDAAYEEAHRHFLRKTVHAGEAYGPESIYAAIVRCHAERIGHGTFVFDDSRVYGRDIKDKAAYADELAEYIATMRITVEVCPTSNLQTIPELAGDIRNHPVKRMIERGMAVAIATDNTLVSHTDLNRELALVSDVCALDLAGFKRLVLAGFKGAFYPGRYMEKRAFVRRAAERFERLVARFKRATANNNGGGGKTCVS